MAQTEAPAVPDTETDPTKEWHKTACVLCSANCGIEVRIDGREIVRVRGDKEHPSSKGYTCDEAAVEAHAARSGAAAAGDASEEEDTTDEEVAAHPCLIASSADA